MKKYYIYKSFKKNGPFSLQELCRKEIKKNDLIWFKGLDDWVKASEIEELKDYFDPSPPPTPFEKKQEKLKKIQKKGLGFLFKVILSLFLFIVIMLIFIAGQDLGITGAFNPLSFVKWLLIIALTYLLFKIWNKKSIKVDNSSNIDFNKVDENKKIEDNYEEIENIKNHNKDHQFSNFKQWVIAILPLILMFLIYLLIQFYKPVATNDLNYETVCGDDVTIEDDDPCEFWGNAEERAYYDYLCECKKFLSRIRYSDRLLYKDVPYECSFMECRDIDFDKNFIYFTDAQGNEIVDMNVLTYINSELKKFNNSVHNDILCY